MPHGRQGTISPTRDRTRAPYSRSRVLTTGPPANSLKVSLFIYLFKDLFTSLFNLFLAASGLSCDVRDLC